MSLGKHQEAFSRDVFLLFLYLILRDYEIRIGEAWRPKQMQEIYVQIGRSQTMNSMHLKKCAIDLHIFQDGKWIQSKKELQHIGDFWESLSSQNRWGGNWKSLVDCPHFERKV